MEPTPGTLLVASAELVDPNFAESVVLLLDVDDSGALGVVLNRPTDVPVADVLESWRDVVTDPGVLFRGGPVGTDGALGVARVADPAREPVGFRRTYADVGLVDLDSPVELVGDGLVGLRIFAGYAGWGADQLAGEIAEGSWYVVAAEAGDVFAADVTDLRRDVLRRQPGELAWVSTRPADPEMN
ncbi:YqgE/AlgH family protein [Nocardioides donggukensis]|uniref:YqgE/AlgH family protein n=1 Tax=Nocardioides donggukensis TaxID=2774019 RepID=A0A927K220_9ACTN|nr:YqgE/AlgH family protein [Nocardioides donggukensis]MBD8868794.1 YqgE/AlgH family protein [Nocardioides donggukensis]